MNTLLDCVALSQKRDKERAEAEAEAKARQEKELRGNVLHFLKRAGIIEPTRVDVSEDLKYGYAVYEFREGDVRLRFSTERGGSGHNAYSSHWFDLELPGQKCPHCGEQLYTRKISAMMGPEDLGDLLRDRTPAHQWCNPYKEDNHE